MNICVLIYSTCYVQLQPLLNTYYTYTNTTFSTLRSRNNELWGGAQSRRTGVNTEMCSLFNKVKLNNTGQSANLARWRETASKHRWKEEIKLIKVNRQSVCYSGPQK